MPPLRNLRPVGRAFLMTSTKEDSRGAAYARLVLRWNRTYPRAVRCLEKDLDELLSFFQIQNSKLWSRLRTTNLIERAFREVRRRTRPMGVMANTQSLQRIVFAV